MEKPCKYFIREFWGIITLVKGCEMDKKKKCFLFEDGNRVCFIGDSITRGNYYMAYIFEFYRIKLRNSMRRTVDWLKMTATGQADLFVHCDKSYLYSMGLWSSVNREIHARF